MFQRMSKLRFLPVTIFAAFLLFTVKVGNIWDGIDVALNGEDPVIGETTGDTIAVSAAVAQEPEQGEGDAAANGDAENPMQEDPPLSEEEAAAVSRIVTNDPTLLTQAEIDLLQQLAERRERLEEQEKEMQVRESLLNAAEDRINNRIEELKVFQTTIEKLIKTYDEQQVAKVRSLVKIYENMKPKDAARIFEEMDMDTLLLVAERMSERKLAPVMAKMNPAKATEITVELSRLRNLPDEVRNAGG